MCVASRLTRAQYTTLLPWLLSNILPRLIQKRAWLDAVLWKGFQKFCVGTLPQGSSALLLRVPVTQLKAMLAEEPLIAPALKRYIKEHPKSANAPTEVKRLLRGQ